MENVCHIEPFERALQFNVTFYEVNWCGMMHVPLNYPEWLLFSELEVVELLVVLSLGFYLISVFFGLRCQFGLLPSTRTACVVIAFFGLTLSSDKKEILLNIRCGGLEAGDSAESDSVFS